MHSATASTSNALVNGNTSNAELNGGVPFVELEGKDFDEQVQTSPIQSPMETLNNQLVLERRIKEGAENFLNIDLSESLRVQVKSELDMAEKKIEAITRHMEVASSLSWATNTPNKLEQRPIGSYDIPS
ncbi:hypothetical protein C0992_012629 [Termitomyces sp. T32_za158]|nr:hypothetical protein C0992_012629 [Termitomyces sp. T32_za158]